MLTVQAPSVTDSTPLDSHAIGSSTTDLVESCGVRERYPDYPPAPPRQRPGATLSQYHRDLLPAELAQLPDPDA